MRAFQLLRPAPAETAPLTPIVAPRPAPGPGQVLLRVLACGVCHTDLHLTAGELAPRKLPITLGHQVVARVEALGPAVTRWQIGERVGVPWLHSACGACDFCRRGEENLCARAQFTGWDVDGGYAEFLLAEAEFMVALPPALADEQAAPLLCAGIGGYRSLRLSDLKPGERLGLFGFGASAHLVLQVARHWGCPVSVFTRSAAHRALALDLGAEWAGDASEAAPYPLDRGILFAPVGALVPLALAKIRRGGTLAVNAIHLSPLPEMDYNLLYGERTVRSVTNATRRDAAELMALAAEIPLRSEVEVFALDDCNAALERLARSEVRGAAVLRVT